MRLPWKMGLFPYMEVGPVNPFHRISLALLLLFIPIPAAAITFDITFTGAGSLPSGTITFAAVNDVAPIAYSFTDLFAVWTETDVVGPALQAGWAAGLLVTLTGAIGDSDAPPVVPTGDIITFNSPNGWVSTSGSGTWTAAVIPEPGTAALLALGCLALGICRRRALR